MATLAATGITINIVHKHPRTAKMPISEKQRIGLHDLFINNAENTPTLLQLAKNITKNVCHIGQPTEALDYLTAHVEDIHILMYKRNVTKELLFKYLHARNPGTPTDFTKSDLILHVINYWESDLTASGVTTTAASDSSSVQAEDQFPIHKMARNFTEWFYEMYNKQELLLTDFWADAALQLTVIADDGVNKVECQGAADMLTELKSAQEQFNFHFNPNLSHDGVQGRMDPHGIVMVLSCGTLHTSVECVGVFECVFGLLRDPFTANNWKIKKMKFLWRSEKKPALPRLTASSSMQAALALPAPNQSLD